jgi:hypothetical protein
MQTSLSAALRGAFTGAVATLPMSGVMYVARAAGLLGEYPPRIITRTALEAVGAGVPEEVNEAAATIAHVGFGAAAGAAFGLLRHGVRPPGSRIVQGVAFGLAVYAVSYNGWIPAVHILPEPTDDRPGRQPSMLAAHVVYGLVLGATAPVGPPRR